MKAACLAVWLYLACCSLMPGRELGIAWTHVSESAGGAKGTVLLDSGELLATRTVLRDGEHQVHCSRSVDGGASWEEIAVIARRRGNATVGDGHLLQLPSGDLLYSYRDNLLGESAESKREYAIRVAVSQDRGRTWEPHSTVASSALDPVKEPRALRGLWSSFLFLTKDGRLHCVYDDEDTPHREGFRRHQWLTMKTWNERTGGWDHPVTVSRARDSDLLSRDGMPSVVELPSGRLICAFETVQTSPPHANLIRYTTSDDGGKTWSWEREGRGLLFEPRRPNHLAMSPWLIRLRTGELICVFATDEDRETPGVSGRPPSEYRMDIKSVISTDEGRRWPPSGRTVFAETHGNYMPGIVELAEGDLLVTFVDYAKGTCRAVRGMRRRPDP